MTVAEVSGEFLGAPGRRIFVLVRAPAGGRRPARSILVVPPFAEEMNKSRRMMTETAQRLCGAGWVVIMPDLFGTGDSEGEFRDALVEYWLEDLGLAARHAARLGAPVKAVLAVRLGCALAAVGSERGFVPAVETSIWWQPVLEGRRHIAQFLRLRTAASGLRGDGKDSLDSLRALSAAGETLTVAGYELSPELVQGIETLKVEALPPQAGALHWVELVREGGAAPPLPATRFVERARASGAAASITPIEGEPFWASTEIVRLPAVCETSLAALDGLAGRAEGAATIENRVNA